MADFTDIPVLDIAPLVRGGDTAALARDFRTAYGTAGFGYITGHGIDPALMAAIFEASRRFHALPQAEKMALAIGRSHRGYIPMGASTDVTSDLATVTKPNQSASFMMMREDAAADPAVYLSGPNRWPDLPGFRATCEAYAAAMSRLGHALMRLALQAMEATDDAVLADFDPPTFWLRLLHYPPRPAQAPEDLYGSAPHRDFGALTLLAQDDAGGLQVMRPGGDWVDAPPLPGAFVVNVGDMLHRMSNGRLLSTPHRVINRSGRERLSVPFFYDPHVNAVIRPLPGTGTPRFAPLRFADFLRHELESGYEAHKPGPAG